MPIDPRIALGAAPQVEPFNPMRTMMQVYEIQQQRQNQEFARERLELQRQEELRLQAAADLKAKEAAQAKQAQGLLLPALTGKERPTEESVKTLIDGIEDPEVKALVFNGWTTFRDKNSEIEQRVASAGKLDQETIQQSLANVANLLRPVRDQFKYSPEAIEGAFTMLRSVDKSGISDAYYKRYQANPEEGKTIIDSLINTGTPERELGINEVVQTATGQVTGRGPTSAPEAPKVDFSMYLPLYARDVLKKPVDQMTAVEYEAAKKKFESLNDAARAVPAPVFIWTSRGLEIGDKSTGTVRQVTTAEEPGGGGGGQPVAPPATAQQRNRQAEFDTGLAIFNELAELSNAIEREAGAWARLTAPVDKARAKLNMDNALALYQSSLQAFSPMLARTLGHTGVLTDIDQLKTEGLMPQVGDDAALAMKKIANARKIFNTVRGVLNKSGPQGVTSSDTTTTTTTTPEKPPTTPAVDPDYQLFLDTLNKSRKK